MSRTINKMGKSSTGTEIPQTITYSDISLDKVEAGMYQKDGTLTAQIRQTVVTVSEYPTKQVSSNMQQGLFETEAFGFSTQPFTNTEIRVAWVPVPANATEDSVKAKLQLLNAQHAVIYKALSNQPILDKNQKQAVAIGLGGVTLDIFANRQIVRFPTGINHPQEGQICLDSNGKVQYRKTFLWNTPLDDQDTRTSDPADVYMSPETRLELSASPASVGEPSVLDGQSL